MDETMERFIALKTAHIRGEATSLEELNELEQVLKEKGYDPEEVIRNYLKNGEFLPQSQRVAQPNPFIFKRDREIDNQRIILRPAIFTDNGIEMESETIEERKQGLKITTNKRVLISCTGKAMEKVGGRCSVCSGYSEEIFLCETDGCRVPLCSHCAFRWMDLDGRQVILCERCYRRVLARDNLWARLERNLRRNNE